MSKSKTEVWKDIVGYEGYYQVSNKGRVKSLDRIIMRSDGRSMHFKKRIRKHGFHTEGYPQVNLWVNGVGKIFFIHRLVAEAFIPNPEDKPQVNHIDSDRSNNLVENLEWATSSDNAKHGFEYGNRDGPCKKRISQLDSNGTVVNVFPSATKASEVTGINLGNLSMCANNLRLTAGTYNWEYL